MKWSTACPRSFPTSPTIYDILFLLPFQYIHAIPYHTYPTQAQSEPSHQPERRKGRKKSQGKTRWKLFPISDRRRNHPPKKAKICMDERAGGDTGLKRSSAASTGRNAITASTRVEMRLQYSIHVHCIYTPITPLFPSGPAICDVCILSAGRGGERLVSFALSCLCAMIVDFCEDDDDDDVMHVFVRWSA